MIDMNTRTTSLPTSALYACETFFYWVCFNHSLSCHRGSDSESVRPGGKVVGESVRRRICRLWFLISRSVHNSSEAGSLWTLSVEWLFLGSSWQRKMADLVIAHLWYMRKSMDGESKALGEQLTPRPPPVPFLTRSFPHLLGFRCPYLLRKWHRL